MCYAYRAARTVIIIVFLLFLLLFPFLFPYVFRETYKLIGGGALSIGPGGHICRLIAQRKLPCKLRATHTHTQTRRQTGLEIAFLLRIIIVNMKFQKLKSECQKKYEEEKKNKTRIRSQLRNDIICGIWSSRVSRSNDFRQTQFITNTHTYIHSGANTQTVLCLATHPKFKFC